MRRDDSGFRVVDLGSTNGTQVNGVTVKEQSLDDGDVIVVGATVDPLRGVVAGTCPIRSSPS